GIGKFLHSAGKFGKAFLGEVMKS
uniref:Magainin-B2 n=1 Tax=Xenopus borealis TaxID=8354 RepID=MAGB2_XENBO|nr:RecName: Full=Magainin-B2 [Xenopus borealis]